MSDEGEDWMRLTQIRSTGGAGALGVRVHVLCEGFDEAAPELQEAVANAARACAEAVSEELHALGIQSNPGEMDAAEAERELLLALFPEPIFVEEIPNGYSSRWYCRHRPWFVVTTKVGRFKVGWRKRVIHLEWTETTCELGAEELFKEFDTTKFDKVIHAWGYEDAAVFVERVMGFAGDSEEGA